MSDFPYEIHPLANLGEEQEKAVLELMDDINKHGYDPNFPITIHEGKLLDGRHRQAACLRLGIVPEVQELPKKEAPAAFVCRINSLKTYRIIKPKQRLIYGIENFPKDGPAALCKRLGLEKSSSSSASFLIKCYKKSRRWRKEGENPWDKFKAGKIGYQRLADAVGVEYSENFGGSAYRSLKDASAAQNETISVLESDLSDLQKQVATRDARIKELEKRVKSLDPQERIVRSAGGEATAEDRLRDRLEFTEEELKKSQKINEQFATKVRDMERMSHAFETAFANVDWTARKVTPPRPSSEGKTRPHEFLALMSDAHYGEVVEPSEALGLSYNADIAKARMEHYRDIIVRFKELRESSYDISKLTVAVLGDMLSGNIHDELRVYNEKNMTEQMTDMTHILNDFAGDFAGEFPEVEFIIIPGNHPRLQKKPEFKKKWDNWEVAMGEAFKLAVEVGPLENVTVTVPHSMVYIHQIFGSRIAMLHGDGIKSNSFAGIPFYGMRNRREGLQALLSSLDIERADMMVMGHFHQHMYWSAECDILINGAIKGGDDYSIGSFLSAPEPVQVLLEFHPEHGLVAQEHITLGHIR